MKSESIWLPDDNWEEAVHYSMIQMRTANQCTQVAYDTANAKPLYFEATRNHNQNSVVHSSKWKHIKSGKAQAHDSSTLSTVYLNSFITLRKHCVFMPQEHIFEFIVGVWLVAACKPSTMQLESTWDRGEPTWDRGGPTWDRFSLTFRLLTAVGKISVFRKKNCMRKPSESTGIRRANLRLTENQLETHRNCTRANLRPAQKNEYHVDFLELLVVG